MEAPSGRRFFLFFLNFPRPLFPLEKPPDLDFEPEPFDFPRGPFDFPPALFDFECLEKPIESGSVMANSLPINASIASSLSRSSKVQ